jgi:hypothetical protein
MIDKLSTQFRRGVREEAHEHPGFNRKQIEELVVDHLKLHPFMYKK